MSNSHLSIIFKGIKNQELSYKTNIGTYCSYNINILTSTGYKMTTSFPLFGDDYDSWDSLEMRHRADVVDEKISNSDEEHLSDEERNQRKTTTLGVIHGNVMVSDLDPESVGVCVFVKILQVWTEYSIPFVKTLHLVLVDNQVCFYEYMLIIILFTELC